MDLKTLHATAAISMRLWRFLGADNVRTSNLKEHQNHADDTSLNAAFVRIGNCKADKAIVMDVSANNPYRINRRAKQMSCRCPPWLSYWNSQSQPMKTPHTPRAELAQCWQQRTCDANRVPTPKQAPATAMERRVFLLLIDKVSQGQSRTRTRFHCARSIAIIEIVPVSLNMPELHLGKRWLGDELSTPGRIWAARDLKKVPAMPLRHEGMFVDW